MTQSAPMPPARRRPIAGMASTPVAVMPAEPPAPAAVRDREEPERRQRSQGQRTKGGAQSRRAEPQHSVRRRPAADYATTRLANFRLPIDLHDRFKALVRKAESQHPRLRHISLTEVVIALLEEGPATPEDIAGLIRRKRADEHSV
jgi:hypothetical protein